jgi:hypothetical protein
MTMRGLRKPQMMDIQALATEAATAADNEMDFAGRLLETHESGLHVPARGERVPQPSESSRSCVGRYLAVAGHAPRKCDSS